MPKHKQPGTLRDAAMLKLLRAFGDICIKCSIEDSVDKLRRIVTFIKEDIGPNVPWKLFPEFYDDLLTKFLFTSEGRQQTITTHQRVMLEIIMDRNIFELRVDDRMLKPLHENDAQRIEGLTKLDLSWGPVPFNFGAFRLQNLIELSYSENCTDDDLKIIGQNCLELRFIDVSKSKEITNEGLRALDKCSKLQTAQINECPRLSHTDIVDFLSAHDTIKEFVAYPASESPGFDCFSHPDMTVYPKINIFIIISPVVSNEDLLTVVKKFPNLQCFGVHSESLDPAIDWSLLKHLKELTTIVIEVERGFSWDNFKPGLKSVGENLIALRIQCERRDRALSSPRQRGLNFLHKFCPNIDDLDINCEAHYDGETLVVPPFAKMRHLTFSCEPREDMSVRCPNLEFAKMPALEILDVFRLELSKEIMASMVTDHAKFPKLRSATFYNCFGLSNEESDHFDRHVEDNNLDLRLLLIPMQQSSD